MVATAPGYWRRLRGLGALLCWAGVVAALGAGCGKGDANEAAPLQACDLLRAAEVEQILDGPVLKPAASAGSGTDALAGRSGCAWSTSDHAKAVLIELVRTQDMAGQVRRTGFSAEARFEAVRTQHPTAIVEDGLSAPAIYVEETATMHLLHGGSYVTVEVASTPPSTAHPAALELARRAVARLEQVDRAN